MKGFLIKDVFFYNINNGLRKLSLIVFKQGLKSLSTKKRVTVIAPPTARCSHKIQTYVKTAMPARIKTNLFIWERATGNVVFTADLQGQRDRRLSEQPTDAAT